MDIGITKEEIIEALNEGRVTCNITIANRPLFKQEENISLLLPPQKVASHKSLHSAVEQQNQRG